VTRILNRLNQISPLIRMTRNSSPGIFSPSILHTRLPVNPPVRACVTQHFLAKWN